MIKIRKEKKLNAVMKIVLIVNSKIALGISGVDRKITNKEENI